MISPDQFIDKRCFRPVESSAILKDEELDQYNRDGYLVVPQFFRSSEVVHALESARHIMNETNKNWHSGPELICPIINKMFFESALPTLVTELNHGESETLLAFIIRKIAGDDRIKPWHQDGIYWGGEDQDVIATFISLTGYDAIHGPLYVIPGSHKLGRLYHEWIETPEYIPNSLVCDVSAFPEPTLVLAKPGDLVIVHSLTLHASFKNLENEDRIMLGCHWQNKEADIQVDQTVKSVYLDQKRTKQQKPIDKQAKDISINPYNTYVKTY